MGISTTSPIFSEEYGPLTQLLARARQRAGISQRELAARLGRSQSHIVLLEKRQRRVDLREFYLICRALELEPAKVFAELVHELDALHA